MAAGGHVARAERTDARARRRRLPALGVVRRRGDLAQGRGDRGRRRQPLLQQGAQPRRRHDQRHSRQPWTKRLRQRLSLRRERRGDCHVLQGEYARSVARKRQRAKGTIEGVRLLFIIERCNVFVTFDSEV